MGFLCTLIWIVRLELGEHLVSRKEMLPLLSGLSIVNLMWLSISFMWLKLMSTWSLVMQIANRVLGWGTGIQVQAPQSIPCKYLL